MAEESVVQETGVDSDKAAAAEKQKKATKKQSRKAAKPAETAEQNKERMLFEKYSYDVKVEDLSLKRYIDLTPLEYPSTFRRRSQKDLSKATLNIVERLENSMMRGGTGGRVGGKTIRTEGRLQGKKIKVMHIIEKAFDAIHEKSGANPLQLYVKALENSAPIEDTTRVRYGGIISNVAVDISASRRLDIALKNIAMATVIGSFGKKRRMYDVLANEIVLAANNDINSYAVKRKNEIERMARSAK
ncbi:30S ribosomal protein S7 [Candidatus Marsarchaeota archaeon]|jgi:small subunit ribosomal protein S7|nr:30S ribosomal protein S7 [Candidatus Marsarchaeota archaeon]